LVFNYQLGHISTRHVVAIAAHGTDVPPRRLPVSSVEPVQITGFAAALC
jgi:hypothetical protein